MASALFFATAIYHRPLLTSARSAEKLNRQLLLEAKEIEAEDRGGREWSRTNYLHGFTSYSSANDLHRRSPTFGELEALIDKHVQRYVTELDYDLGRRKLIMSNSWLNVMRKNAHHSWHIHPHSVISGTYYVAAPKGASPIRFEDPRVDRFMAAPLRRSNGKRQNQMIVAVPAQAGMLVLFESWLRHEVPVHRPVQSRISISFNYS